MEPVTFVGRIILLYMSHLQSFPYLNNKNLAISLFIRLFSIFHIISNQMHKS